MTNLIDKIIIICPQCKQKLRLPLLKNKILSVICSKCRKEFNFDYGRYRLKQGIIKWSIVLCCITLFVADIILPFILPFMINISEVKIKDVYEKRISNMKMLFSKEKDNIKKQYTEEVAKIDSNKLKEKAREYYEIIWHERKNYDKKYAITPREKAQLEMLALSNDKTKNIEGIIKNIAEIAAPKNSTINVYTSGNGFSLGIDFDMSELTSGEEGIRTKHSTVDSLKHDVVRLVSKVTKDVYEFCQNLELESIAIGCRHYVNQYDKEYNNSLGIENIILYKVKLDKKDLKELKDNPFLDIYSTTKYFKTEIDDFSNLKISMSKE